MEKIGQKNVLFVCAQNKIRSVTAEKMFAGSPNYKVRSRGVANDARIRLTEGDLGWADLVFVMEKITRTESTRSSGGKSMERKSWVCSLRIFITRWRKR